MPKITSATIHPYGTLDKYQNTVVAKFEDGSEEEVLTYYPDELTFSPDEFIGLDKAGVNVLFCRKDKEYLRS